MTGWVRRWWRGEAGVAGAAADVVAAPLESLYRGVAAARGRWHARRAVRAPLPVVSVGNLTVGGTGKTPFVRWVVEWLQAGGVRPAVVSRGYGHDELMLHRSWYPEVPVIADRDRVAAVVRAAEAGAQIAVVDDGFQHRRLVRDLDLVLIAAETPFPGRCLPRGPYREGAAALARASAVIVTRKSVPPAAAGAVADEVRRRHPGLPVARVAYLPAGWQTLDGQAVAAPRGPLHVVTSVAWPETVRALVEEGSGSAAPVTMDAFPDHHDFTVSELARVAATRPGATLVVTEKDAVKMQEPAARAALQGRTVAVLTLEVTWDEGRAGVEALLGALRDTVREGSLRRGRPPGRGTSDGR